MNPGFLDAPNYMLFALAFRRVRQGGWRLPVVSAAIAPFLHESAVFVWSPLMVLTAWEMWLAGRILPRLLAPLAVLGLSTCAILCCITRQRRCSRSTPRR